MERSTVAVPPPDSWPVLLRPASPPAEDRRPRWIWPTEDTAEPGLTLLFSQWRLWADVRRCDSTTRDLYWRAVLCKPTLLHAWKTGGHPENIYPVWFRPIMTDEDEHALRAVLDTLPRIGPFRAVAHGTLNTGKNHWSLDDVAEWARSRMRKVVEGKRGPFPTTVVPGIPTFPYPEDGILLFMSIEDP